MDCLVLVGGKGRRLLELSGSLPKPLLKIGQKTIIEHVVSKLITQFNISRIFLLTKYRSELFHDQIKILAAYGCSIKILEQKELLGTGGAILEACSNDISENFIVCNGDTFIDSDVELVREATLDPSKHHLILCSMMDDADYDEVIFDKSKYLVDIKRILTPKSQYYAYSGICICNRQLMQKYSALNSDLSVNFEGDIIKKFKNDFKVITLENVFYDLGTPSRIENSKAILGVDNE